MSETNEWEFQGEVISWVNTFLESRSLGLDRATQEFTNADGHRSDMILWRDKAARSAVLATELKRPSVLFKDFEEDAIRKAQKVHAPYMALWNMRQLDIYRTPAPPRKRTVEEDFIATLGSISGLVHVEDWLKPKYNEELQQLAVKLVLTTYDLLTEGTAGNRIVEPTVFVDWLGERTARLRRLVESDFRTGLGTNRALRISIRKWAEKQGLEAFVADLDESLSAQLAYRLVGQVLFYYALGRHEKLPVLKVRSGSPVSDQLRTFWDHVRQFDYEALYEASPLEQVPLSQETDKLLAELVEQLGAFDWNAIDVDVLGAIFENMIPPHERRVLGQYYTPLHLVDLVVALTLDTPDDIALDPGVGTGTFLYRAYDRLRRYSGKNHLQLLEQLWGLDISAFPAELSVINLYRLDLAAQSSFPRIAVRDFFEVSPGDLLLFPPAKRNPGSTARIEVPLPAADAVFGNPPYVRSQQLDDLDPGYKKRLATLARKASVARTAKWDAFAYYILHAVDFLREGGRLGFVVPGAWLNSEYGAPLQRFLLSNMQPVMVLMSEAEVFFPSQDVNVVVIVADKLSAAEAKTPRKDMRFVTLTTPIQSLVPDRAASEYWDRVDALAGALETAADGQHDDYRVAVVDAEVERKALQESPQEPRDWTRFLRTTPIYRDIFEP